MAGNICRGQGSERRYRVDIRGEARDTPVGLIIEEGRSTLLEPLILMYLFLISPLCSWSPQCVQEEVRLNRKL
jgi:hypothetical protein